MLEPVAFVHAVDEYLDSLTPEELRAMVLRSIKHLDGAHRAQLALFLGLEFASVDPIDEVAGSAVGDRELRAFIDSCGLLRERFGAFLRDNPRAIYALGRSTSERIFGTSENKALTFLSRVSPKAAALAAVLLLLAFVPLAAQYARQRGMLAGLSEVSLAPQTVAPVTANIIKPAVASQPGRGTTAAFHSHAVTREPKRIAARHVRPKSVAVHEVAFHPARARHVVTAQNWKFDPKYNPYFNHRGWHTVAFTAPHAPSRSVLGARAELMVNSYLHAVIAGNTLAALHHLGLPANANPINVAESAIVTRDTRTNVVAVDQQPDGRQRVEVDLTGRTGEYFETFYVARDGPALRITDRFYIPVNRTAEERAAHLLAKDGH
jgi:hypothetical protein